MAPPLLSESRADRIVETCREETGDRLRSVTYFTRSDFEQLYLRSDLQQDADLTTFIGLEWRESDITEDAYRGTELGRYEYTMRGFENGYLLRVETDRCGVFVTMDGLTIEGFEELAAALNEVVEALHDSEVAGT